MAEMATESLIALIEGEDVEPASQVLPFELKIRETA
ncbi:hypothetical protein ALT785_750001 [Alteromonas infernus]